MAERLFIHHDGALGDVLLSLPAFSLLGGGGERLHLAGRPDVAGFLQTAGVVAGAHDSGSSLFSSLYAGRPDNAAKTFLAGFDRAVVFTRDRDAVFVETLRSLLPRTAVVTTIPPEGERMHVSAFRMQQIAAPGRYRHRGLPSCALEIPAPFKERARALLARKGYDGRSRLVAMHPGSGGRRKCWPFESFISLAAHIRAAGDFFFVFLSGPAEESAATAALAVYAESNPDVLHVPGEELAIVAALLQSCSLYIGNDSGITHLAAAAGGKVLALFGPTDPGLWSPPGDHVRVVASGHACAPCGLQPLHRIQECGQECLRDIGVGRVMDAIGAFA